MKKIFSLICMLSVALPQSRNATLTLYKDGFGLVKQPVSFRLASGANTLRYSKLPDKMEPQSPFLSLDGADVSYQRFNYDVFDTFEFLKEHRGETVTVSPLDGKSFTGTLLDIDGNWLTVSRSGMVKIFNIREVGDISVRDVEGIESVTLRPGLSWKARTRSGGRVSGELVYISRGLDWDASYRLVVSPDETYGALISEASVKNETNLDFLHANLRLVEGKLHRVHGRELPRPDRRGRQVQKFMAEKAEVAPGEPAFERGELGDYEDYVLSEPVSLPQNESVTISFRTERKIKFSRLYLFENYERSSKKEPLVVQLSFHNSADNNLGETLPAGLFQVYYSRADGSLDFAGEDFLEQLPKEKEAKVIAGRANKVLGERKVLSYDRRKKSEEAAILLEITNQRDDTVSVQLTEHIYGDWVIREPSHNYKKKDAQTIQFDLTLPPGTIEKVAYNYRKEWQ